MVVSRLQNRLYVCMVQGRLVRQPPPQFYHPPYPNPSILFAPPVDWKHHSLPHQTILATSGLEWRFFVTHVMLFPSLSEALHLYTLINILVTCLQCRATQCTRHPLSFLPFPTDSCILMCLWYYFIFILTFHYIDLEVNKIQI